jgi:hypothetical protein
LGFGRNSLEGDRQSKKLPEMRELRAEVVALLLQKRRGKLVKIDVFYIRAEMLRGKILQKEEKK